jgi:hypothetical protein
MRRDRLLREYLRERFAVTMTTGETFDGLLDDHDESHVRLIDVITFDQQGQRAKVDGALLLPRSGIAYMQRTGVT